MYQPYIDLHTHSNKSDGQLSRRDLVLRARDAGIRILAITDHNYTEDLTELRAEFGHDMTLIQGAEISCNYTLSNGGVRELHVIGLGFDPNHPAIQSVLRRNQPNRRPYVEKILKRLEENQIFLGSYESLAARFPNTKHLGRKHIAAVMVEKGYCKTDEECFDVYIGSFGQKKAFVPPMLEYVSLECAVESILAAGGHAVLCHPIFYRMEWDDVVELATYFKQLTGDKGAMEVYYGLYSPENRLALLRLADRLGLMYSAASDYHSEKGADRIDHRFSWTVCAQLLTRLGVPLPEAQSASDILVVSGFSGSGKGTVLKKMLDDGVTVQGKPIQLVTSVTTRSRRSENDNYIFLTPEEFARLADDNGLLECNGSYGAHSYGTPIAGVRKAAEAGIPCLEIDPVGLMRLITDGRVHPHRIHSVFLTAAPEELLRRLKKRGTEDDDAIRRRLTTAMTEATYVAELYDAVIPSNVPVETAAQVIAALEGHRCESTFDPCRFQSEMHTLLNADTL